MNNIKEKIVEKGLKSNWVAKQLGVKPSDISNWASGERKPNQERLVALAGICRCSLKDIYTHIK